jgi:hypothetical protein
MHPDPKFICTDSDPIPDSDPYINKQRNEKNLDVNDVNVPSKRNKHKNCREKQQKNCWHIEGH